MSELPKPETMLAYASAFEKPYRNVAGGTMHEPGEPARAAAKALRIVAGLSDNEALREALKTADDLISELANKFYKIDPYTRGGVTESDRSDLATIDKVKAKIRAALSPAREG